MQQQDRAAESFALDATRRWTATVYEKWMEKEGIPIHMDLVGVNDVAELPLKPWARMGGRGTFVELRGMMEEGLGVYVGEIPGGGALEPERHLYQEAIYIIKGRGITEVWYEGESKATFEWGDLSAFSPPLNTWHRLINGSREPVLYLAVTTAPGVMTGMYESDFIFNCDQKFPDHFDGNSEYFAATDHGSRYIWETNFIPHMLNQFLVDPRTGKVHGGLGIGYRMAGNFPVGHLSEWPVGVYHKAHYHGPGALLLGLRGQGYVLMWPKELGTHPYENGHEDQVARFEWKHRSIYSPPNEYFHMHLNTSTEPARNMAIYGVHVGRQSDWKVNVINGKLGTMTSTRDGGAMIDYEDEDPQIRRDFEEALKKAGIKSTMPEVAYR